MKKKLISLLTTLCMTLMLFTGVPISVSAETLTGNCGAAENEGGEISVKWSLDTDSGVLTISGTGSMYNYNYKYADTLPWYNSMSTITSVVIEDGVTSIGGYAFWGASNLTSIEIPGTVEFIGVQTFYRCKKLTSITIPESVTDIRGNAFGGCPELKTIFYPDTCNPHENAFLDVAATLIKYTVNDGNVTISAITDNKGKDISETVEIPPTINGMDVVAVAKSYQGNVGDHTHTGGTATCTKKAKCTLCGNEYGNLAAHSYSSAWTTDSNQHWHVCTKCGTAGTKTNHSWGTGTVTTAATCTAAGVRTYTCTCGKTKTETIDKIAHSYSSAWTSTIALQFISKNTK